MKKLLSFIVLSVFAFTLTGCDPYAVYYFNIKNDTEHELTVEIEGQEPVIIKSGEKEVVHYFSRTGGGGDCKQEYMLSSATVKINDRPMSNEIWRRSNWEYTYNGKNTSTYTLTIDDNFLNNNYLP